jgi:hypothetical protein
MKTRTSNDKSRFNNNKKEEKEDWNKSSSSLRKHRFALAFFFFHGSYPESHSAEFTPDTFAFTPLAVCICVCVCVCLFKRIFVVVFRACAHFLFCSQGNYRNYHSLTVFMYVSLSPSTYMNINIKSKRVLFSFLSLSNETR